MAARLPLFACLLTSSIAHSIRAEEPPEAVRLDDNALVWQSVERPAGGVALRDTDEIVLMRKQ